MKKLENQGVSNYFRSVKIIRSITLLSFILITFFGTIGIDVFTHSCKNDGVSHSFFIQHSAHCAETTDDVPACCAAKKKAKTTSGCCTTEVKHITATFDFSHHYSPSISLFPSVYTPIRPIHFFRVARVEVPHSSTFIEPPPKHWGKQLLIQHQVFRI